MIEKTVKNLDHRKMKEEILNLRKILLNLNFQKSTGQLEKTSQIRKTKKDIAKLKTQISKIVGDKDA